MSTNFPASQDDGTTLPNPASGDAQNSPNHASQHANANDAIKAVQAKLGTGASTPAANKIFKGDGAGTSTWGNLSSAEVAAIVSDETGAGLLVFGTSPTLVTPKMNVINEATADNGVSIDGFAVKDGQIVSPNSIHTGGVVQIVSQTFTAVSTGTTLVPFDDTIPQITEGNEYMTLSITPKSATNMLVVEVKATVSSSAVNNMSVSLFQDATANAVAVANTYHATPTAMVTIPLTHSQAAGTTSATTFRVRCGQQLAGTMTFNGASGSRLYGAITKSAITITEYRV